MPEVVQNQYRRVACLSSIDYYVLKEGEWARDVTLSQPTLTEMINTFLDEQDAQPWSVSSANIAVIQRTDDLQVHRSTVSLIYSPKEVSVDGQEEQQASKFPAGIEQLAQELGEQIKNWVFAAGHAASLSSDHLSGGDAAGQ